MILFSFCEIDLTEIESNKGCDWSIKEYLGAGQTVHQWMGVDDNAPWGAHSLAIYTHFDIHTL